MTLLEALECGCCYELMVDPTTLTCGHSFCRYCLAKWFNTSNKTECPECRQTWTGFPHINVHLRTIAETSFPKEARERKAAKECFQDYSEVTEKFEALGQGKWQQAGNVDERMVHGIIGLMFLGACIMVALSLIVVLYYCFTSPPKSSTTIYFRTVDQWTPLDVGAWARGFTNQLGYDYSMSFTQAGVNGQLLVGLTDDDLASLPLNISTHLHRKIIIGEIRKLNMTRVKHPTDLWEYKNAHQGNVLFLLFMLQDSPRLTFVYLHYMEYHTIFVPFLHDVIDREDCGDKMLCSTIEDYGTLASKVRFYLRVLFFPYYLILKYAWQFTDTHFFTSWMVISHCVMLTFGELSRLYKLPGIIRDFPRKSTEYVVTFVITCIWYWSLLYIVPAFLLDIVFYGKLYYGPIETANKMRNGNFQATIMRHILHGVAVTGEGIAMVFRFFLNRRIQ